MNVEQRREYFEKVRGLSKVAVLRESGRLRWRIDLTGYGAIASLVTFGVLAGYAISHNANAFFLVPAGAAVSAAFILGKMSADYMERSNIVNSRLIGLGLGVRLSSFQRMGLALMRGVSNSSSS